MATFRYALEQCENFQFRISDDSDMSVLMREDYEISSSPVPRQFIQVETDNYLAEYSAMLTKGQIYGIVIHDTSNAWLEINEKTLDYSDQTHGLVCNEDSRMSNGSAEKCGLIAITTMPKAVFYGQTRLRNPVLMILNATQPCAFRILLNNTEKTLHVSIAEQRHFGSDPYPDGVTVTSIPSSNTSVAVETYTNQSLILRCLIPDCQKDVVASWCQKVKETCTQKQSWMFDTELVNIIINAEPGISTSYEKVDNNTLSINLKFPYIHKSHGGSYDCAFFRKHSSPSYPSQGKVTVTVNDPSLSFSYGNNIYGNDTIIEQLSTKPLDCIVDGQPLPTISWSCSHENKKIPCPTETYLMHGQSIQVNQSGICTCTASNQFGMIISRTFNITEPPKTPVLATYLQICLPILFGTLLIILIILLIDRRQRSKRLDAYFKELPDLLNSVQEASQLDNADPSNNQGDHPPYNTNFEIARKSFLIQGKVADGEFGCIFKGKLNIDPKETPEKRIVAVKIPQDPLNPDHYRALLGELRIMCHIRSHVNVLSLIGACTTGIEKRQLFILTDFCEHGSLKDYLTENRTYFEALEDEHKRVDTLLSFAYQAATGMAHLASEHIIHRDLALRNLLLTDNGIICCSVVLDGIGITSGWSFGIVLWEMFNCGRRPYPEHEQDMAFRSWLRASEENRMGPPKIACQEIYHLMRECWKVEPAARPTFSLCKRKIGKTLEKRSNSMYIDVVRTLSEANFNMARNGQLFPVQTNPLEHRSPLTSGVDSKSEDVQSEENRGECSMQMNEIKVEEAINIQCEDQSQQPDCQIVMVQVEERKVPKKRYVAASLTRL